MVASPLHVVLGITVICAKSNRKPSRHSAMANKHQMPNMQQLSSSPAQYSGGQMSYPTTEMTLPSHQMHGMPNRSPIVFNASSTATIGSAASSHGLPVSPVQDSLYLPPPPQYQSPRHLHIRNMNPMYVQSTMSSVASDHQLNQNNRLLREQHQNLSMRDAGMAHENSLYYEHNRNIENKSPALGGGMSSEQSSPSPWLMSSSTVGPRSSFGMHDPLAAEWEHGGSSSSFTTAATSSSKSNEHDHDPPQLYTPTPSQRDTDHQQNKPPALLIPDESTPSTKDDGATSPLEYSSSSWSTFQSQSLF